MLNHVQTKLRLDRPTV